MKMRWKIVIVIGLVAAVGCGRRDGDGQHQPVAGSADGVCVVPGLDAAELAPYIDTDGWVNYHDAYVGMMSAGVTMENNGARQIVMALGPDGWVSDEMQPAWLEAMELTAEDFSGEYFERFNRYWDEHGRELVNDLGWELEEWEIIGDLQQRPWQAEEWPEVAAWLAENEAALDLIVAGAEKPHYYLARVAKVYDERNLTQSGLMGYSTDLRRACNALTVRAMNRTAEGQFEAARRDIRAVHRMGQHIQRQGTMMAYLQACGIEMTACVATRGMINHGQLSEQQLVAIIDELNQLPQRLTLRDAMVWEHAFMLDGIRAWASIEKAEASGGLFEFQDRRFDPERFAEQRRHWAGRELAALCLPTVAQRLAAWNELIDEVDAKRVFTDGMPEATTTREARAMSSETYTDQSFYELLNVLLPPCRVVIAQDGTAQARADLTHLMAGCELYRRRNGEYPPNLEALATTGIMDVPVDVFTGEALVYFARDDRCVIYSLGPNGTSDRGCNEKAGLGVRQRDDTDDIGIMLEAVDTEDEE